MQVLQLPTYVRKTLTNTYTTIDEGIVAIVLYVSRSILDVQNTKYIDDSLTNTNTSTANVFLRFDCFEHLVCCFLFIYLYI